MIYLSKHYQVYQLDHCTYHCSYHIVWTPKYRGKVLSDQYIKQELKREFKQIAQWIIQNQAILRETEAQVRASTLPVQFVAPLKEAVMLAPTSTPNVRGPSS